MMKVPSKWLYVIFVSFFRQIVGEPPVFNEYSTTGQDGYSPPPPPPPPPLKDQSDEGYRYVTPVIPAADLGQKEYDAPVSTYQTPLNTYPTSPVYKVEQHPSGSLAYPSNRNSYISSQSTHNAYRPPFKRKPFKSILYSRENFYKKYASSLGGSNKYPFSFSKPSNDVTAAIFKPRQPSQYAAVGGYSKETGTGGNYGNYGSNRHNSDSYNEVSAPAYYEFSYKIEDYDSASDFGHKEGRNGDTTWGSYSVLLPDGRRQIVEYTADAHGYRPKIRYEHAQLPRPHY